jgi:hypothetical protein
MTKSRRDFRVLGFANLTWDAPSVADETHPQTTAVNIPGAKTSDAVLVTADTPTAGIIYDAYVSAPSTVTVRANNLSGSGINPAATGLAVVVFRG